SIMWAGTPIKRVRIPGARPWRVIWRIQLSGTQMPVKPVAAVALTLACALLTTAAGAAATGERTPYEVKARELYAHVIAMPTSKGKHQVRVTAAYLSAAR